MLHLFHKSVLSDGEIDLTPVRYQSVDRELGFGRERIWVISLHGSREEIGQISYRDGESKYVYYFGHIGYHIDPPWRGRHFAFKACRLIRSIILISGKTNIVITCDPDNYPSKKTCEKLGCRYESAVEVPESIRKRYEISSKKLRYIWQISR